MILRSSTTTKSSEDSEKFTKTILKKTRGFFSYEKVNHHKEWIRRQVYYRFVVEVFKGIDHNKGQRNKAGTTILTVSQSLDDMYDMKIELVFFLNKKFENDHFKKKSWKLNACFFSSIFSPLRPQRSLSNITLRKNTILKMVNKHNLRLWLPKFKSFVRNGESIWQTTAVQPNQLINYLYYSVNV